MVPELYCVVLLGQLSYLRIFLPPYLEANLWSTKVITVNPDNDAEANGSRPVRYPMMEQTYVTDANLQKELLLEYEHNSKNKS